MTFALAKNFLICDSLTFHNTCKTANASEYYIPQQFAQPELVVQS